MNAQVQAILDFWFGAAPDGAMRKEWFQSTPAFDAEIRARFADDVAKARRGDYDAWRDEARACLALIILLDQFPRNLFRDSAEAFASDGAALAVTRHAMARGYQTALGPMEQMFLFMPFQHSEDRTVQAESVAVFGRVQGLGAVPVQHAQRHHDEIKRFGRFPYRNAALGRTSTAEEEKYLEEMKV